MNKGEKRGKVSIFDSTRVPSYRLVGLNNVSTTGDKVYGNDKLVYMI